MKQADKILDESKSIKNESATTVEPNNAEKVGKNNEGQNVASEVKEIVIKYIDGTSTALTKTEDEDMNIVSQDDTEKSDNESIEDGETNRMESFKGKWEQTSVDQFEEYLEALGVNFYLRKVATISKHQVMEVSEDDGLWTIKTSNILKSMELKFRIGEEFDHATPDGRAVTVIVTLDGNKLICVQKAKKKGEKSTKHIREFNGDECILTSTIYGVDDLICVQKFKRM